MFFYLWVFCLFVLFLFCFGVFLLLKRATLSANLKFVRFSSSALIRSKMSDSLKTFSITVVNSLGESGSPCLTPLL